MSFLEAEIICYGHNCLSAPRVAGGSFSAGIQRQRSSGHTCGTSSVAGYFLSWQSGSNRFWGNSARLAGGEHPPAQRGSVGGPSPRPTPLLWVKARGSRHIPEIPLISPCSKRESAALKGNRKAALETAGPQDRAEFAVFAQSLAILWCHKPPGAWAEGRKSCTCSSTCRLRTGAEREALTRGPGCHVAVSLVWHSEPQEIYFLLSRQLCTPGTRQMLQLHHLRSL